jgi:PhnB protein
MVSLKPIPDGYSTVTPYLIVSDVNKELEFIERALGGSATYKMQMPDGFVSHAEAQIGTSRVMIGGRSGVMQNTSSMFYLYVEDIDRHYQQAVNAGAESLQEPQVQFYGDRTAAVKDPFGNQWYLASHVQDVTPDEMQRRMMQHRASQA